MLKAIILLILLILGCTEVQKTKLTQQEIFKKAIEQAFDIADNYATENHDQARISMVNSKVDLIWYNKKRAITIVYSHVFGSAVTFALLEPQFDMDSPLKESDLNKNLWKLVMVKFNGKRI